MLFDNQIKLLIGDIAAVISDFIDGLAMAYTSTFHRKATLVGRGVKTGHLWGHPSSGKDQGQLKVNQRKLIVAQDCERKWQFRISRFVSYNQAVL